LISFLRLLHHSSLYNIEMFIKSNWNAHNLKWLDQNFCPGPLCRFLQNLKTFLAFDNSVAPSKIDLKVLHYGTLFIWLPSPLCRFACFVCFFHCRLWLEEMLSIFEGSAYPSIWQSSVLSRNIKLEGSKLVNVKHQKSILLERCLCALSIGDFCLRFIVHHGRVFIFDILMCCLNIFFFFSNL